MNCVFYISYFRQTLLEHPVQACNNKRVSKINKLLSKTLLRLSIKTFAIHFLAFCYKFDGKFKRITKYRANYG